MVPPMEFIPIAEETGMIAAIERLVMQKSCAQVAAWNAGPCRNKPIKLSLNVSARRFLQEDLVEDMLRTLATTGLLPSLMKLEITETVIMENRDAATRLLLQFKQMNAQVALDDFGTGYSSLGYLHRFPIDVIKIDRTFVKAIGTPDEAGQIVRTIVDLAHNLNLTVTAEGVETVQQRDHLKSLGCELGQGYLFSKPVDAESLLPQLLAGNPDKLAA
jgi:EAL domain-containing protein (putative c-di-GMP-specific phosphodiesterase class I)